MDVATSPATPHTSRRVQTDMTKLTVALGNFANAPKKLHHYFRVQQCIQSSFYLLTNNKTDNVRVTRVTWHSGAFTKPVLQWENNKCYIFVCACVRTSTDVCLLTYPVCHAQLPYCLRPLWLHRIFWHYLINGTILCKKSQHKICVLIFSKNFTRNIAHSKMKSGRYCQMCKRLHYFCRILMKTEFSRHIFDNVSNIKCHKN